MAIADVIKYEGDNTTFIWKHPTENFNTLTQLIVDESQEAIFYMNGQALDLFGAGRHTLETQNIPKLTGIFNLPTGGVTPFKCHVYFINKVEQMAIKWGTDSRVEYIEPTYQFPLQIGASGEMSIRVQDSRRLLVKLVGTERQLYQDKLTRMFRSFLMTRIKSYLARKVKENKINIFEIDSNLDTLSSSLKKILVNDFTEYGVSLEQFFVTTIVKPEGERNYEKFKELHFRKYADVTEAELRQKVEIIEQQTEAQKTVIESQGIAQKRSIEGYTYQQERGFDVAEKVGQNEGAGNFSSAGIGMGMIAGVGNTVGSAVGGAFEKAVTPVKEANNNTASQEPTNQNIFCEDCGNSLDSSCEFCDECGAKVAVENKPVCNKCGFEFKKDGKFCPKCGTKRGGTLNG